MFTRELGTRSLLLVVRRICATRLELRVGHLVHHQRVLAGPLHASFGTYVVVVAQARTPAIARFPFHHTCLAGNSRNDIGTGKIPPGTINNSLSMIVRE